MARVRGNVALSWQGPSPYSLSKLAFQADGNCLRTEDRDGKSDPVVDLQGLPPCCCLGTPRGFCAVVSVGGPDALSFLLFLLVVLDIYTLTHHKLFLASMSLLALSPLLWTPTFLPICLWGWGRPKLSLVWRGSSALHLAPLQLLLTSSRSNHISMKTPNNTLVQMSNCSSGCHPFPTLSFWKAGTGVLVFVS